MLFAQPVATVCVFLNGPKVQHRRFLPVIVCNWHSTSCRFASFLGILTLESFTSASLGLAVGSVAPSTEAAVAIGPAVMVIFIVFGGGVAPVVTQLAHLQYCSCLLLGC